MFITKHLIVAVAYCLVAAFIAVNTIDSTWIVPPTWDYLTQ